MNILVVAREPERPGRIQHRQGDIRSQRSDLIAVHKEAENFKLENQKAGCVADPVPSGRSQVLHRTRRQAQ